MFCYVYIQKYNCQSTTMFMKFIFIFLQYEFKNIKSRGTNYYKIQNSRVYILRSESIDSQFSILSSLLIYQRLMFLIYIVVKMYIIQLYHHVNVSVKPLFRFVQELAYNRCKFRNLLLHTFVNLDLCNNMQRFIGTYILNFYLLICFIQFYFYFILLLNHDSKRSCYHIQLYVIKP